MCVHLCVQLRQEIGKNALFRLTIVGPGAKFEAPETESAPVSDSVGDYAGLKSESEIKSESVITLQPGMGVASKQNGIGINEECKGESDSFLTKSGKNANAHDALLADKSSVLYHNNSTYTIHVLHVCASKVIVS